MITALTSFVLLAAACVGAILIGAWRGRLSPLPVIGAFLFSGAGLIVWALVWGGSN